MAEPGFKIQRKNIFLLVFGFARVSLCVATLELNSVSQAGLELTKIHLPLQRCTPPPPRKPTFLGG